MGLPHGDDDQGNGHQRQQHERSVLHSGPATFTVAVPVSHIATRSM
jgi:hypothetical protein